MSTERLTTSLTGELAQWALQPFNSSYEMTAAIGNPRYAADPAYREAVAIKLARSDEEQIGIATRDASNASLRSEVVNTQEGTEAYKAQQEEQKAVDEKLTGMFGSLAIRQVSPSQGK
jgi:hypothetical protein